ncbi:Rid family detoxifying hydrolase [Alicyclobacillus tolerans]|uniref:RidA family protein n=1 Tax=Alicyclobacillus tolerans TaxID=90970 RepID=UPI001F017452|nr:Rid family detoxifying hydrolase [Alicyclobacillus tolerans]MCF8566681.1 Rid family detoxifying hydrolase [Alicyclobacillus tolerans]
MKQVIRTNNAPNPAGPYSQGLRVGNRIYVAGQGPANPATGKVESTRVEDQTRQVLKNIEAILTAGGATMDNVVKVTAHLADLKDFQAFNEIYKEFFNEPFPVRTTVGSQLNNISVEIDVIAELE